MKRYFSQTFTALLLVFLAIFAWLNFIDASAGNSIPFLNFDSNSQQAQLNESSISTQVERKTKDECLNSAAISPFEIGKTDCLQKVSYDSNPDRNFDLLKIANIKSIAAKYKAGDKQLAGLLLLTNDVCLRFNREVKDHAAMDCSLPESLIREATQDLRIQAQRGDVDAKVGVAIIDFDNANTLEELEKYKKDLAATAPQGDRILSVLTKLADQKINVLKPNIDDKEFNTEFEGFLKKNGFSSPR